MGFSIGFRGLIKAKSVIFLLFLTPLVFTVQDASALTVEIEWKNFMQYSTEIGVGDTVQWNWDGSFHTVTSGTVLGGPDGIFDSGFLPGGSTYSFTFQNLGDFDYWCQLHGANQVGVVNVVADPDTDGDGQLNSNDNCPLTENSNQYDLDVDGTGDVCDSDTVVTSNTILPDDTTLLCDLTVDGATLTIPASKLLDMNWGSSCGITIKNGGSLAVIGSIT